MTDWFKRQVHWIESSQTLRLYGFFLSLTHVLTFFYWNKNYFFVSSQSAINAEPLCFPFFPDCDIWRSSFPESFWVSSLYFYLALALLSGLLFLSKKATQGAYILLFTLCLLKLFFHLSNYNFTGNTHGLVSLITFGFLLLPHKIVLIKYFMVTSSVIAGLSKVNVDWLTGSATRSFSFLPEVFSSLFLYYVIFLQSLFVFGLLHKSSWIRRLCLFQFFGFFVFSWYAQNFFQPLVMLSLFSPFFIDEFLHWKKVKPAQNLLKDFFSGIVPKKVYWFLLVFILTQILPLVMMTEPSLSGAPQLMDVTFFNPQYECQSALIVHKKEKTVHLAPPSKNLGSRFSCDPLVYLNQAHQLCRLNKNTPEFDRLSFTFFSKKTTQHDYRRVLDIQDVCSFKNPLWAEFSKKESQ